MKMAGGFTGLSCAAAALFAFLTYRFIFWPALFSPLARIPNAHWSVPFSRLWILRIRFTHRENKTLFAAHRRHGPIVRVGPSELSIDDVDCVRTVYQGGFEKTSWYSVFDNYGAVCMFSARPSAEHSVRKRLISHVYSKSYMQSSPAASAQGHAILSERFLPILERSAKDTQLPHGIDIYSVFMAATMDFIASYLFGLRNGTDFLGDKAYREHFLELYRARQGYGYYDQEMPQFTRLCRKIGIPFCPKWVDAANKELGDWCLRLCDQISASPDTTNTDPRDEPVVWKSLVAGLRKDETTKGKDSLLYPAVSNFRLSVASELFDHVLAGQETAGLALTYLTWRLSQSLELQEKLRTELLGMTPNLRQRPDGTIDMPDPKKLDSLPLLHAVLTETLRLHAPIPGPQPRQTPEAGCRLGSYHVPGGVRVAALAYTLHRDEAVFPDAEKWDHTRWLPGTGTEDERKLRNRQFWAFGSGGRMCIGSNFAMNEMKLMIAAIYSNYTSHIVDDEGVANQSDGYTSRPANEQLYLRFEKVV
ncbi:hypothetical protein QC763_409380 [Podospora pseudopauciseta]|uniref:Cytochrome P450 E-class, group I n=1 Tax=Podospora pseudopauciseta TaxID=2093780 RepID=A0ABR0HD94_9PEZI|nr:hypothetical protein QC763_409380 [Podospora pseudopauciseta]